MHTPFAMPARPSIRRAASSTLPRVNPSRTPWERAVSPASPGSGIEPAGCCAEVCVDTPLGRVCHCVLDLPIC